MTQPRPLKPAAAGYTLTELMISVAIIGILASVGPPMFIQLQRVFLQSTARTQVQRNARQSLDTINRFLRQGVGSTIVIDQLSGQPPYSRITFTNAQGNTVSFWQNNKTLYMKNGNNQSILANDLAYIAFVLPRTDSWSIVNVSVTMQENSFQGATLALELSIQQVRVMN